MKRSTQHELDSAILQLNERKAVWAKDTTIAERIELLSDTFDALQEKADEWIKLDMKHREVPEGHWDTLMSIASPLMTLRLIRHYRQSLEDIQTCGRPRLPGRVRKKGVDQISVDIFPGDIYDQILFRGFSSEVWLEPGVTKHDIRQASAYHSIPEGRLCLVLGAGNVTAIPIADALYKLIVEKQVVLLKLHPLTEYLGELIEYIFAKFIDKGFLKVVYGDVEESAYLCHLNTIDDLHLTGSDKTFDSIIFGPGEEGLANKKVDKVLMTKPFTVELGNISPVIIVPGPWSQDDIVYQACNIAFGLCSNGGYNCLANRLLVQKAHDPLSEALLNQFKEILKHIPNTLAFYPGAEDKLNDFIHQHPSVTTLGQTAPKKTPWTLWTHLDPHEEHQCLKEEIFGSFMAETRLEADTTEQYLKDAVQFCNEKVWGNLCATIIVHPRSLKNPAIKKAVDNAMADLKYGTVCLNQSPGISYILGMPPWGAYAGNSRQNIQSGIGFVHNTYMLEEVQKTILTSPFKLWPEPMWFPTNRAGIDIAFNYLEFEKKPSFFALSKVIWKALF